MDTTRLAEWKGPDGAGYWYANVNMCVLNVRWYGERWQVFVDGDLQREVHKTREAAQSAAVKIALSKTAVEAAE